MKTECYPIALLPGLSRLFLDFAERREPLTPFYPASAYSTQWMTSPSVLPAAHRATLCDLLEQQNRSFGASDAVFQNIERLRDGAGAVVTGQQVTLFGGPLFTILKAATAIRKAKDASVAGSPHVPIFWLATEDHDLAEADHVTFPDRHQLKNPTTDYRPRERSCSRQCDPGKERGRTASPGGRNSRPRASARSACRLLSGRPDLGPGFCAIHLPCFCRAGAGGGGCFFTRLPCFGERCAASGDRARG